MNDYYRFALLLEKSDDEISFKMAIDLYYLAFLSCLKKYFTKIRKEKFPNDNRLIIAIRNRLLISSNKNEVILGEYFNQLRRIRNDLDCDLELDYKKMLNDVKIKYNDALLLIKIIMDDL